MAAPLKPWERAGVNSQSQGPLPANSMSGIPPCCESTPVAGAFPSPSGPPPPVPVRPTQSTLGVGGMRPYSSGLGMGYSPYSSYGSMYNSPYSSFGGYGYGGMNRFGQQDSMSTFARHAEENSRPAFQAIENVVSAVSSVGMMMDSTFQAVYNSFRAVIGVADNMSRLRSQLVSVISALAFVRTLKYIFRRFLELVRLRPAGHAAAAWNDAVSEAAAKIDPGAPTPKSSAWPIIMFFGIILGAPWLIWKLIRSFAGDSETQDEWANGEEDHFVARAEHDFNGNTNEISFRAGQMIKIAPKELQPRVRGWMLGCADGKTQGLLPANYVKVLGKRRGQKYQAQAAPGAPTAPAPITQTQSSLQLTEPVLGTSPLNSLPDNDLNAVFQETEARSENMDASDILDRCPSEDQEFSVSSQGSLKKDSLLGKTS